MPNFGSNRKKPVKSAADRWKEWDAENKDRKKAEAKARAKAKAEAEQSESEGSERAAKK